MNIHITNKQPVSHGVHGSKVGFLVFYLIQIIPLKVDIKASRDKLLTSKESHPLIQKLATRGKIAHLIVQGASQNQLFQNATFNLIEFSFLKQMSDNFIQYSQPTTLQKRIFTTYEAHKLSHPKKRINHSLGCEIYHLNLMNYSLWR